MSPKVVVSVLQAIADRGFTDLVIEWLPHRSTITARPVDGGAPVELADCARLSEALAAALVLAERYERGKADDGGK